MENKAKEILKERYPHHRLYDDKSFELEHFTGEEMIEFTIEIVKASLEKASEEVPWNWKETIINIENIVLL